MSKLKAQKLMALLGDRKEAVLSLLSETNAEYLRDNIVETSMVHEDELTELLDVLNSTANITEPEDLIEDTDQNEDDLQSDLFDDFESNSDELDDFNDLDTATEMSESFKPIADTLKEQDPALVAFFLKKLEDDKRESILNHLSDEYKSDISDLEVKDLPISNEIYEQLYNDLFKDWN